MDNMDYTQMQEGVAYEINNLIYIKLSRESAIKELKRISAESFAEAKSRLNKISDTNLETVLENNKEIKQISTHNNETQALLSFVTDNLEVLSKANNDKEEKLIYLYIARPVKRVFSPNVNSKNLREPENIQPYVETINAIKRSESSPDEEQSENITKTREHGCDKLPLYI